MSALDEARAILEQAGGQYEVLRRLARGELRSEDLPALQAAAADLGLSSIVEALRRLSAGHTPTMVLTFLVATGEFPGLIEKLQALRSDLDTAASVARAFGAGRR